MSRFKDIFPSIGAPFEKVDSRKSSATKKGPGRKHKQGAKKGKAKPSTYKRSAVSKVQVQQQTDNVANTPLKSATRGG